MKLKMMVSSILTSSSLIFCRFKTVSFLLKSMVELGKVVYTRSLSRLVETLQIRAFSCAFSFEHLTISYKRMSLIDKCQSKKKSAQVFNRKFAYPANCLNLHMRIFKMMCLDLFSSRMFTSRSFFLTFLLQNILYHLFVPLGFPIQICI